MQQRVRKQFKILQEQEQDSVPWYIINADQNIEEVSTDVWNIVQPILETCRYQPISKIWQEGYYEL
jgi:thymidylate kinase